MREGMERFAAFMRRSREDHERRKKLADSKRQTSASELKPGGHVC